MTHSTNSCFSSSNKEVNDTKRYSESLFRRRNRTDVVKHIRKILTNNVEISSVSFLHTDRLAGEKVKEEIENVFSNIQNISNLYTRTQKRKKSYSRNEGVSFHCKDGRDFSFGVVGKQSNASKNNEINNRQISKNLKSPFNVVMLT